MAINDANQTNHYMVYSSNPQELPVEVYDTTYTLTGLQPNTEYSYYVRTVCMDGNYSEDSAAVSFRTSCTALLRELRLSDLFLQLQHSGHDSLLEYQQERTGIVLDRRQ